MKAEAVLLLQAKQPNQLWKETDESANQPVPLEHVVSSRATLPPELCGASPASKVTMSDTDTSASCSFPELDDYCECDSSDFSCLHSWRDSDSDGSSSDALSAGSLGHASLSSSESGGDSSDAVSADSLGHASLSSSESGADSSDAFSAPGSPANIWEDSSDSDGSILLHADFDSSSSSSHPSLAPSSSSSSSYASHPSIDTLSTSTSSSSLSLPLSALALSSGSDSGSDCHLYSFPSACGTAPHIMTRALSRTPPNMIAARDAAQIPHGVCGRCPNGDTLLHVAALADDADTAGLALARGVKPMVRNRRHMTALDCAASVGALSVMRLLLGVREVRKRFDSSSAAFVPDCGPMYHAVAGKQLEAVVCLGEFMEWELGRDAFRHEITFLSTFSGNSEVAGSWMLRLILPDEAD